MLRSMEDSLLEKYLREFAPAGPFQERLRAVEGFVLIAAEHQGGRTVNSRISFLGRCVMPNV